MAKRKVAHEVNEGANQTTEEKKEVGIDESVIDESTETVSKEEYDELAQKAEELQKASDNYKDMYQRLLAEFDNYKKRTIKERETNMFDAKVSVITKFLPVIDNIERAEKSFESEPTIESLKQGVDMVFKQIMDVMESEEVECIKGKGEEFNPEYHNAVMHIEDDTCDINIIVEEFQKGYVCKDKVIRHSMVKVAN